MKSRLTAYEAGQAFNRDIDALNKSNPEMAKAVVMVCDSVDFAVLALIRNGIDPTPDAVAAIACQCSVMIPRGKLR